MGQSTGRIAFDESSGTGNQDILSPSGPLATGWVKCRCLPSPKDGRQSRLAGYSGGTGTPNPMEVGHQSDRPG